MPDTLRRSSGPFPGRLGAAGARLLSLLLVVLAASGCGPKVALEPVPLVPPGAGGPPGVADPPEVRWIGEAGTEENETWRTAVGPAVVRPADGRQEAALDSLVVVSWNTHVGGGDVERLIGDLSAGELTGGDPPGHFVLVLQEVFRDGPDVPETFPDGARVAGAIREETPRGERFDVEEIADRHDLDLFYVPSMRNGDAGEVPEDRGNAILSTIPLSGWTAVELPVAVQRRVAVAATVRGETGAGSTWELDLVSLHLDGRAPLRHLFGSFGRGRARQLDFLARAWNHDRAVLLGGDLNTWFREGDESAVDLARRHFPQPAVHPPGATFELGPWGRRLDWIFFRGPERWRADYVRLPDRYGSDHYPLLARVRFDASSRSAQAPIPRTTRRLGCVTEGRERSLFLPRPTARRLSSPAIV